MDQLLPRLRHDYPDLKFECGANLSWSPEHQVITYSKDANTLGILHETSHAILKHAAYTTDINLLRKETEAWATARVLAAQYCIDIDEDHIERCLDTYRDWLHKRSTCPRCNGHGLQSTQARYTCPNCQATWEVSSARFCRPYRRKISQNT